MELFEKSDFQPIRTFALLFIKIGIRRESELGQLTKFLVKCLFLAPKNPIFFSLFSQNLHQIFSGLSKERIYWNRKNPEKSVRNTILRKQRWPQNDLKGLWLIAYDKNYSKMAHSGSHHMQYLCHSQNWQFWGPRRTIEGEFDKSVMIWSLEWNHF